MLDTPGKYSRWSRLTKNSKRLFIVALDHGGEDAIYEGLQDMPRLFNEILNEKPNALILNEGVYLSYFKLLIGKTEVILNIPFDPKAVEFAAKLDVVGVKTAYFGKAPLDPLTSEKMRAVARAAYDFGLIYINEVIPVDPQGKVIYDAHQIARIARVAAEYGGDMVKTAYAEPFETIVEAVPVPVIIAGGEKGSIDIYKVIEKALRAGAQGVAIGRNIFQSPNPREAASRIRKLVEEV
ncbi:class I fructose-bisphosphate aldolase [Infirmifilum uzonense]|uniref:class I fructose-bisphosphate aldolase n=1 Tax=Infirmifilum uzonense TaxID=1550241 RepID=UPI003C74EA2E